LPPINEFARPYQSKNNGIYAACETGELSSLLGLEPTAGAGWINHDPARRGRADEARDVLGALGDVPRELRPLLLWRKTMLALADGDRTSAKSLAGDMEAALDAGGPVLPEHRIMAHFDLAKFWSQQGEAGHAPFRIGAKDTGSRVRCRPSHAKPVAPFSTPTSRSSAARDWIKARARKIAT
jgi:hypothetical protein